MVRRSAGPLPSAGFQKMFSLPPVADPYVTRVPSGVQIARAFLASDVSRVSVPRAEVVHPDVPVSLRPEDDPLAVG